MPRIEDRDESIVAATVRLLETEGYDAVNVRRVAAEASISLATLYRLYGSLDELIIRAIERWMADNAYSEVDDIDETGDVIEALVELVRAVYKRWENKPQMLVAFARARSLTGGRRLDDQGFAAVMPKAERLLAVFDQDLVADYLLIAQHVNLATLQRFADDELSVAEVLDVMETTLRRTLPHPTGKRARGLKGH